MELKLHDVLDFSTRNVFIGELVQTYVNYDMSEDKVDIAKLQPLLFDMASKKYWSLGEPIKKGWNVGKLLKQ
jgi:flavin reductase (DIM6/NTAB) family NADH-FMN oxidoreductase RutF